MSRSFKLTPIHGITLCRSERIDKQIWHRRMRMWERNTLSKWYIEEKEIPHYRSISNVWSFGKDGKYLLTNKFLMKLEMREYYKLMGK